MTKGKLLAFSWAGQHQILDSMLQSRYVSGRSGSVLLMYGDYHTQPSLRCAWCFSVLQSSKSLDWLTVDPQNAKASLLTQHTDLFL